MLLAGTAAAHAPVFGDDNTAPERAQVLEPPEKSRVVYTELGPGEVRYYELHLEAGDRLTLGTFTPGAGRFTPSLVVMGPGFDDARDVPAGVVVPDGDGAVVVAGERPADPEYEPFTPAAIYHTTDVQRTVETGGRYLVAVYEPSGRAGSVGVVVGDRESFTAVEYLRVAWDLPRIYLWGGDHPLVVFGPSLLVVLAGGWAVGRRLGGRDRRGVRAVLALSGLLVVGSALGVSVQLFQALWTTGPTVVAAATGLLVAVPLALGALAVRLAVRPGFDLSRTRRATVALLAGASAATWAGYLVAPAAMLVVALWPDTGR